MGRSHSRVKRENVTWALTHSERGATDCGTDCGGGCGQQLEHLVREILHTGEVHLKVCFVVMVVYKITNAIAFLPRQALAKEQFVQPCKSMVCITQTQPIKMLGLLNELSRFTSMKQPIQLI